MNKTILNFWQSLHYFNILYKPLLNMEENDSLLTDISTEEEAPFGHRTLAIFLDMLIEIIVIAAIYFSIPKEILLKLTGTFTYMRYLLVLLIILLYRTICIFLFDKTIGMFLFKLKYLNNHFKPLSFNEKLIAVFLTSTSKIKFFRNK